jgi:hypothetical protein
VMNDSLVVVVVVVVCVKEGVWSLPPLRSEDERLPNFMNEVDELGWFLRFTRVSYGVYSVCAGAVTDQYVWRRSFVCWPEQTWRRNCVNDVKARWLMCPVLRVEAMH